jgi:hypothetical protein
MMNKHSKPLVASVLLALGAAVCAVTAVAQISPLTDAEKNGGMGAGGPPPGARKAQATVKPSSDPRDLRGTYTAMGGGGPGGGPGGVPGGMGGGTGFGAPPGGAGGPNGGMAGGPPGGGAGGDGPPEYPQTAYCIPSFSAIGWVEGGVAIMQTKDEITLAAEERHYVRHIYLTDKHSSNAKPSYVGDSIGHWEGNTLVIETTMLINNGVVNERWTKDKDGNLVAEVKQTGGKAGVPGADGTFTLYWSPDNDPLEWICEDFSDNYMKQAKEAEKKAKAKASAQKL